MNPHKTTARISGMWYFLLAILAIYGVMYVPSQIVVSGDASATAKNFFDNELLFRSGVAANVISHTVFIFLILFLYRLLKHVNEHHARLMVGLAIVGIPIAFLGDVSKFTAFKIMKGEIMQSFAPAEMNDLGLIFLKTGAYCAQMVAVYWGLWLIPLGLLIIKSGFIPRILGFLLLMNGAAYVINCFTFLTLPIYMSNVTKITTVFIFIGEVPLILWLLVVGAKNTAKANPHQEIPHALG